MAPSLNSLITELEKGIIPALQGTDPRLRSYRLRLIRLAGIVKFQELLNQFPVPVKVVRSEHGFHLSDCVWSEDDCTEGPDTCSCFHLFDEPEKYFIVKQLNQVILRDGSHHHKDCLIRVRCQCNDPWRKKLNQLTSPD